MPKKGCPGGCTRAARSSSPTSAHGTAGIAAALATAGHQQARSDWISAAVRGAEHLVSIADLADGAMRVPHYVPHGNHDEDEYTYSWCHGPTGTSYLFLALAEAGVTSVSGHHPLAWHSRCLQAVINSDVPARVRPGFWDNDGRCCGTAGVGEMFLDDAQRLNRSRAESQGSLAIRLRSWPMHWLIGPSPTPPAHGGDSLSIELNPPSCHPVRAGCRGQQE